MQIVHGLPEVWRIRRIDRAQERIVTLKVFPKEVTPQVDECLQAFKEVLCDDERLLFQLSRRFDLFRNSEVQSFDELEALLEFSAREERILRDLVTGFDGSVNCPERLAALPGALGDCLLDAVLLVGGEGLRIACIVKCLDQSNLEPTNHFRVFAVSHE